MFLVYSQLSNHNHNLSYFKTFHHPPPKKTHTYQQSLPISLQPFRPRQPRIYFLSSWIFLFWTFQINGIIQYVVFCVWLLSLGIMFSRLIHVVVYISTSSFLFPNNTTLYGYTTFSLSIYQ